MIFKCKNCGGNTVYEPGRKRMYCPHCESLDSEDRLQGGSVTQCANCGAPITISPYASSGRCEHCGTYIVFNERVEGEYEPQLILPFKVSKDAAVEMLHKEFKKKRFCPPVFYQRRVWKKWKETMCRFGSMIIRSAMIFSGRARKYAVGEAAIRNM